LLASTLQAAQRSCDERQEGLWVRTSGIKAWNLIS
jgi:hypothetical protein